MSDAASVKWQELSTECNSAKTGQQKTGAPPLWKERLSFETIALPPHQIMICWLFNKVARSKCTLAKVTISAKA